jgi:O-antigen/teichoic acid export membrane protein
VTETPVRTLRSLVVSGVLWGIGTNIVIQIVRIGFAIALARFLTPHEYGLATMALVFSAIVYAFLDLSLGIGLIQRPAITEADRSTVFWSTVALGLTMTAGGIALSGPIAAFFGEPEVQPLLIALSPSLAIGALGATHSALLQRQMAFRRLNLLIAAATLTGGAIGVALAAAGFGPWAIIVQGLCISVVTTALLWLAFPWRPRLLWSKASFADMASIGVRMFGVRALDFLRLNADKLLVGRLVGSASLGVYSLAFNMLVMPIGRLFVVVMDTLVPAFSRLQSEPARVAAAWLRINRLVAAACVPALVGLAVVAPEFVAVVLGPQWAEVASILQLLTIGVIAICVTVLANPVLIALNQTKLLLRFSFAEVALLLAGIALGTQWGLTGVAVAFSAVTVPTRVIFAWLTSRMLGIRLGTYFGSLTGVAQASLGMLVVTVFARSALEEAGVAPWLQLVIVIALGACVYLPLCLWRVPEVRAELARFWSEGIKPRAVVPAR